MANGEKLAEADLCLNRCICCLQLILATAQRTPFCQQVGSPPQSRLEPGSFPPPSASLLRGDTAAAVWLKHDIPSQQAEEDTKCYLFVLSQSFQRHGCAPSIQSSLPLYFSFALPFGQDYCCSRFYQWWQTRRSLHFWNRVPWDLGILSTGGRKKTPDWTDVSDTLCDASPADPAPGICCERLKWDFSATADLKK